jgi:hypothetical protein
MKANVEIYTLTTQPDGRRLLTATHYLYFSSVTALRLFAIKNDLDINRRSPITRGSFTLYLVDPNKTFVPSLVKLAEEFERKENH